jgi:hypothetical protein
MDFRSPSQTLNTLEQLAYEPVSSRGSALIAIQGHGAIPQRSRLGDQQKSQRNAREQQCSLKRFVIVLEHGIGENNVAAACIELIILITARNCVPVKAGRDQHQCLGSAQKSDTRRLALFPTSYFNADFDGRTA